MDIEAVHHLKLGMRTEHGVVIKIVEDDPKMIITFLKTQEDSATGETVSTENRATFNYGEYLTIY